MSLRVRWFTLGAVALRCRLSLDNADGALAQAGFRYRHRTLPQLRRALKDHCRHRRSAGDFAHPRPSGPNLLEPRHAHRRSESSGWPQATCSRRPEPSTPTGCAAEPAMALGLGSSKRLRCVGISPPQTQQRAEESPQKGIFSADARVMDDY